MVQFLAQLRSRNESLFYFSAVLLLLSVLFYLLTKTTSRKVAGVNAWFKPFKFAVSIALYCSTMAWFCYDLPGFAIGYFNWANIVLFGFEIIYITIQAARGQESYFNRTTPFYRAMFGGMAVAAILITLLAAYAGLQFFRADLPGLPAHYVWAIRLSICIFIIFSFEGVLMGGRQTHTIGVQAQHTFLPLLQWNRKEGDLRVAHFIGMHALQIIPLLAFYVLKDTIAVAVLSGLHLFLAIFVLIQALQAKPFIRLNKEPHEIISKRTAAPQK